MWNIRKLAGLRDVVPNSGGIQVYIPNEETWEGVMKILHNAEGNFRTAYPVEASYVREGVLFDDGFMKVTAFGNTHLSYAEVDHYLSYSYLIECEGKKLVYSGDLGKYEDLDPLMKDGCDGLIIETGHFGIDAVKQYVADKKIGRLFFSHNGREILNNPETSAKKVEDYFEGRGLICTDGITIEL